MAKKRAAITGIGAYIPEYRLTNNELSNLVDTSDEWIMQRIGIKERRILKDKDKATCFMGSKAVKSLLTKTDTHPQEIDLLICATITPDMPFPATANIIANETGLTNAWSFDLNAACSGFIFALTTASQFIEAGTYKKVIVVAADKMSSITNYKDRTTCPLFGDAGTAVLLEPTTNNTGIIDHIHQVNGKGHPYLHMKSGGSLHPASHSSVSNNEHYISQEGQIVFKHAVTNMTDVTLKLLKRNNLSPKNIDWLVPHQANMRIIEAVARHIGIDKEKVMINIQNYGNTTSATIPLCLWDYEKTLKKGDNIILTAFGAGFTWGAIYLTWAYNFN